MTVTLPSYQGSHADHNPFPGTQVFLKGLEDTVSFQTTDQECNLNYSYADLFSWEMKSPIDFGPGRFFKAICLWKASFLMQKGLL